MGERSMLYEAMVAQDYTLRELAKRANLGAGRLSDMRLDQCSDATEEEVRELGHILATDLTYMLDAKYKSRAAEKKKAETDYFERMFGARKAIIATGKKQGTVTCTICGSLLHFQVHSNGHVWAKCETTDCLCWIE